jgi:hypothetical protein
VNATDTAAWIGAVTGTLALFWEIFVWAKTGPKIEVSALPNMEVFGALAGIIGNAPRVVLEARNVGNAKTTITHVVGFYYESWLQWFFRRRPTRSIVVPDPTPGRLPHVLDAGERWVGMMEQNDDLIEMRVRKGACIAGYSIPRRLKQPPPA